jgi:hypothetical protein
MPSSPRVDARAEIVLPAGDLEATLAFFAAHGFALESIFPAESPRVAVVSGLGIRVRLDVAARTDPGEIVIWSDHREDVVAPNGTRLSFRARVIELPPIAASFVLTKNDDAASVAEHP